MTSGLGNAGCMWLASIWLLHKEFVVCDDERHCSLEENSNGMTCRIIIDKDKVLKAKTCD